MRNAETIENHTCSVGTIECVEVDTGNPVIQKIVTLFQGEVNADALDHFRIVFAPLQSTQQFGWKTRAPGQLGNAFESTHGGNRHDSGDDRDADAGERAPFAEIKKVAIIEK